jgi:tetratricopeptide (TPR) repeat protein
MMSMQRLGTYDLLGELGHGGMGVVYRAHDRLSGKTVALKRIRTEKLNTESIGHSSEMRIHLAKEFQLLSGLRHPNIIDVLDYGFDADRQPYYVMALLDGPRSLFDAALRMPLEGQVSYVVEMLQALAYLHRHGVIHRDLKPANVLVDSSGAVKVLDFGLASMEGQEAEIGGTLAYMGPEVLMGKPATPASDLYAVGIIIFELLAGRHPFDTTSSSLVYDIMEKRPELDLLDVSDSVREVVDRLLEKDPPNRYQDAYALIADLCAAVGQPVPPESEAIRRSFLESARFVGRDDEFEALLTALNAASEGRGSAWLVGGESGIGKSRLLDELRIQALVNGAVLLRGQEVAEAGSSYGLWVDVLRRVAATTDLSDLEAGVLKAIVPDMAALLGRTVPDAPEVDAAAGQQRLISTVVDVIVRMPEPVLLLLEDLHWSNESLDILRALLRVVNECSLLIVASYRDDERPGLPAELAGAFSLKLERLPEPSVAELALAMLGEGARQTEILELLQRETEGNVFFLVEVLRALAEDAGGLGRIGGKALPARIMAGGVQQIIRRRLNRVPAEAHALLKRAAVAGRGLDLALLATFLPAVENADALLQDWLTTCANATVIERQDGRWRFAHDKLRESLMADLSESERPALHRQVAEAIERLYPQDDTHAAALAEHWQAAGDTVKEAHFAGRAGMAAAVRYAHDDALAFLDRALRLLPESAAEARFDLLKTRLQIHHLRGEREPQGRDLAALRTLAAGLDARRRAMVQLQSAVLKVATGDFAGAIADASAAADAARTAGDPHTEAEAQVEWGTALWRQADYPAARAHFERILPTVEGTPRLKAYCLRNLGVINARLAQFEAAEKFNQQALDYFQRLGDRVGESAVLRDLGAITFLRGNFPRSRKFSEAALQRSREIGDRVGEGMALNNLGVVADSEGDYVSVRLYLKQALELKQLTGDRQGEASTLLNLGFFSLAEGDYGSARFFCEEALNIQRELGDRQDEANALTNLGMIAAAQGALEQALTYYDQAYTLRQQIQDPSGLSETAAYRGLLHQMRGDLAAAERDLTAAVEGAKAAEAEMEEARALHYRGHLRLAQGALADAAADYEAAIALLQDLDQPHLAMEPRAGLARVRLAAGEKDAAREEINRVMAHLNQRSPDGMEQPGTLLWNTYRVLRETGDGRAFMLLRQAYEFVQVRAGRTGEDHLHRSLLEQVPDHRALVAEWDAVTRSR